MTALAAALLRPQLAQLPRRVARWNEIHDRISDGSGALPACAPAAALGACTLFSNISAVFAARIIGSGDAHAVLDAAKARGVPVKWFGADTQIGFTSAPRHWAYAGDQGALAQTHHILATLCDIRTPVTLTDEECDLIAQIMREVIETIVAAQAGTGATGRAEQSPRGFINKQGETHEDAS